jgi:hypothetical protein
MGVYLSIRATEENLRLVASEPHVFHFADVQLVIPQDEYSPAYNGPAPLQEVFRPNHERNLDLGNGFLGKMST